MVRPLPADLPLVLTPKLADRWGITPAETRTFVARGSWRRFAPGLLLTRPDPPTRWHWAEAGVVLGGATAAVSGWEALDLRGLVAGPRPLLPVLVLVREGRSRNIGPLLVRRTDRPFAAHVTPAENALLPLTPAVATPRAVADTALLLPALPAVRAVVSRAVQRRGCQVDDIVSELGSGPRAGSAHLRRAVGEVGEGARSTAEASALGQLRRSRIPDFEFNVPVLDRAGRLVFEIDVLWRAYRAAMEIDGRAYHLEGGDWEATLGRHNLISGGRLSVTHDSPRLIDAPDGRWLGEIEHWLRGRAAELGVPYRPGSPRRAPRQHDPEPLVLDMYS
jgi:predicted transcriptional regulator